MGGNRAVSRFITRVGAGEYRPYPARDHARIGRTLRGSTDLAGRGRVYRFGEIRGSTGRSTGRAFPTRAAPMNRITMRKPLAAAVRNAPGRNRTCDLALRRRALYPLSYWRGEAQV